MLDLIESGGAKLVHGSGDIALRRAEQDSTTLPFLWEQGGREVIPGHSV